MKRFFLPLFASIFLLFAIFSLALPKETQAIPVAPTGLGSEHLCLGTNKDTSEIRFSWTKNSDYKYRIWYTGLSQEYIETTNTSYNINVDSVTIGTTYEWHLAQCDGDVGSPFQGVDHGCSNQIVGYTPGPTIVTEKCPPDQPNQPPPQYNCSLRDPNCTEEKGFKFCDGPYVDDNQGSTPSCGGFNKCAFDGNPGRLPGETRIWYCAFNNPVSCDAEGVSCDDSISRNGQSTCCSGLICDPRTSSNGICKKPTGTGPGQNLCIDCPNGYEWDEKTKKCSNNSGETAEGQQIACLDNETCMDGVGCVNKECEDNGDCLSGICNEKGICESALINLACSPKNVVEDSVGNLEGVDFVCRTAIGPINASAEDFAQNILRIILGIAGGILVLLIIINGYKLMISQGDPEKLKDARDGIIAAIAGILLIIFALALLQLITVDVIGIPGFR